MVSVSCGDLPLILNPVLPSNQASLGALPFRFRRERVLIVCCGDVGMRLARDLGPRVRLLALTSTPARLPALRAQGILPLSGNLDDPASLRRLAALATRVVHLAPPPGEGHTRWWTDPRTRTLLRVLRRRTPPRSLVYGSTSGVYGDCAGEWVTETRPLAPRTPRAQRRATWPRPRWPRVKNHVRSSQGPLRLEGRLASDQAALLDSTGRLASRQALRPPASAWAFS